MENPPERDLRLLPPIEEATPPEPDPALTHYYGDYGEGKTAEEEIAGQRVLAALCLLSALITITAIVGIVLLLT